MSQRVADDAPRTHKANMADKPIDILAGFKTRQLKSGQRTSVEFKAPELLFNADENKMAKETADAIAALIKESLLNGTAPDGTPLPPADPTTTKRRNYRDKAWDEGRITKADRKQFRTGKLGTFDPRSYDNTTFGRESGMLAKSVIVIPAQGAWLVRFAGPRAVQFANGSAVTRVFRRIHVWSQAAQDRPEIQSAMRRLAQNMWVKRSLRLMQEIKQTFGQLSEVAERAEQIGDTEGKE